MKPLPPCVLCLLALCMLACIAPASAQSTVFIACHADSESVEKDSPLSAKGRCRAECLSMLLADARIRRIYTNEYLAAQQTAAHASFLNGVRPVVVPSAETENLVNLLHAGLRLGGSTLVVGHRESIPNIAKALSGVEIEDLGVGEFTRLIAITIFPDGRASAVTMRFGLECDNDKDHSHVTGSSTK